MVMVVQSHSHCMCFIAVLFQTHMCHTYVNDINTVLKAKTSAVFCPLTGKLTLKIPWKNLYSQPTVAILEGLYVVAVPKMGEN